MKKKIFSILLSLIMCVPVFSGCGSGGAGDVITLKWVTCENGPIEDMETVMKVANEYSKKKIGVTVEMEYLDNESLTALSDSGKDYDMIFSSDWLNRFDPRAAAGMFYDITDLVKNETPELYSKIDKYWDAATVNDRIYGVPTLKDMGSEMMFRFNSDYFVDTKGMSISSRMKFSDVEKYLKAYKTDYPDSYPLGISSGGPAGLTNFLERIVETMIFIPYEGEIEAIPFWESEELMERYRLLHKWYQEGYISPNVVEMSEADIPKETPVRFGVAWKGYMGYSNPDDWGFDVAISTFDGPYISRKTEQGALTAINANCTEEKAIAALKYIELLNTDRYLRDVIAYGIEGTHFRYIENGTLLQLKDGLEKYNPGLYNTGSVVNASIVSASEHFLADPSQWEKVFAGYSIEGIYGKTKGFVYDQSAYEDVIAELSTIYSEYSIFLRTGAGDPEELIPELKERLEAAGINDVIADVNRQLKEHMANS